MRCLILISLLFTGCCQEYKSVPENSVKFKAGDKVKIGGFYSNCIGTITGYMPYIMRDDSSIRYSVNLSCASYSLNLNVTAQEYELVKVDK